MDSQRNNELLVKYLEDNMISLSNVESNVDLLGPDLGLDLEEIWILPNHIPLQKI